ncbi:double-stranded RNA-binding protein Staufen homolog isoform X2 [Octopus sinensis]|uniref:Double-stranded RNA-binding protein Staufen homolog isoform X2 n=1 Tax=Octopus sinensis TaxID=2607531 RepID=A0A6P7S494_9MOLL|nr:double-stranded RNA-binding protein Staufen homolog isoform X2 [Octopus sinensis]
MSQILKNNPKMKLPTTNQGTMPVPPSVISKSGIMGPLMMSQLPRNMAQSQMMSSSNSSSNNLLQNSQRMARNANHNNSMNSGLLQNNSANSTPNNTNSNNGPTMGTPLANQSHSAPSVVSVGCSTVAGGHNNEAVVVSAGNSTTALPSSSQSSLSQQQQPPQNLANTKEKTSMCLINELARFNKVSHMYTLVDEIGPAHKKTFFVKLKLGEEEYSASGPSIKKAQHAAASIGLEKTAYKHPPPKPSPKKFNGANTITPTVELNALAMKRGEPAIYKTFEHRHPFYSPTPHNYDYRGYYNQRYHFPRVSKMSYVSLKVGHREFSGEGLTRQAARHNAAAKALQVLHNEPIVNTKKKEVIEESNTEDKDQLKSEISLVHEIALKRNLTVSFEVTRESGPPHMKTFVTQCSVGEFVTEAEGNSKQVSKKRAAESMLEELKNLQPLPPTSVRPKAKSTTSKKKNRNLIKMQKADPNYGVGINPISRLIQIRQANKKKEPIYSLIAEHGLPWRREFVMQVTVDDHVYTGVGQNKKLAKRNAAEGMLQLLGYSRPAPQPAKPAIKTGSNSEGSNCDKKVTFLDTEVSSSSTGEDSSNVIGLNGRPITAVTSALRPEQQLRELAHKHQIEVHFQNYAVQPDFSGKNTPSECLSRVSLSTDPPQVLHGTGPTLESSRDAAALQALKMLAEKGLSVVVNDIDKKMNSGDRSPLKLDGFEKLSNSSANIHTDHQNPSIVSEQQQ